MVGEKGGSQDRNSLWRRITGEGSGAAKPEVPKASSIDWEAMADVVKPQMTSITVVENGKQVTKRLEALTPQDLTVYGLGDLFKAQNLDQFFEALTVLEEAPDVIALGGPEGSGSYGARELMQVVADLRTQILSGKDVNELTVPNILQLRALVDRAKKQISIP